MRTIVIAISLATLSLAVPLARTAEARDLQVPDQFPTIKKALRKARPGDRIVVADGTYRERVVCRKPNITFSGDHATWRTSRPNRPALSIRARGVVVEGFDFIGRVDAKGKQATVRDNTFQADGRTAVRVRGRDASVERNEVRGASMVDSDRAAIEIRGRDASVNENVLEHVSWVAPPDDAGAIHVTGPGASVQDNRIADVEVCAVRVDGDAASVLGNQLDRCADGVAVHGDDATVGANTIGQGAGIGVLVEGDAAVVTENTLRHRLGEGITVLGGQPAVLDNDVLMATAGQDLSIPSIPPSVGLSPVDIVDENASACPAIVVRSEVPGGTVSNNVVVHAFGSGLDVAGDDLTVTDNVVQGRRWADTSVVVVGSGNQVSRNTTHGSFGFSLVVTGDDNVVADNVLGNQGAGWDEPRQGLSVAGSGNDVLDNEVTGVEESGILVVGDTNRITGNETDVCATAIVVRGDENLTTDNTVTRSRTSGIYTTGDRNVTRGNRVEDCAKFGFVVFGDDNELDDNVADRCFEGFNIGWDTVGTEMTDCSASDSATCALSNSGEGSVVVGNTFMRSGEMDVINRGTFARFENNVSAAPVNEGGGRSTPGVQ